MTSDFVPFQFDARYQDLKNGRGLSDEGVRAELEYRDQTLETYLATLIRLVRRAATGVSGGGYAEQVDSQSLSTTPAVVTFGGTDCAVTANLKAGRTYRISALTNMTHDTTDSVGVLEITENGTTIQTGTAFINASGYGATLPIWRDRTTSADQTVTYGLEAWVVAGTGDIVASGTAPTHITVEDLGILPS